MRCNFKIKRIKNLGSIRKNYQDDLLITCASFEERFLGVPYKVKGNLPKNFILFRFNEPNNKREEMIKKMEKTMSIDQFRHNYHQINVEHGKSIESIIEFHDQINIIRKKLPANGFFVTVDITTFTKDLLLNLIFYLVNFLHVNKLRLLYTTPERYASPEEGWLSFGIKSLHIPPLCWNEWSPLKDNLLILILGFEEMRAWSLIDKFSADSNWLFVTNPGSKSKWNRYCEEYNKKLLKDILPKDTVSALDPLSIFKILSKYITRDLAKKYNIFISPLGTKPQLIGTLYFSMQNSHIPINIITTTAVRHNIPYYSWGIGDVFEFFFPITKKIHNE